MHSVDITGIYDFIQKGGPVMYPIIFFSLAAMTVFFERLFTLREKKIIPISTLKKVFDLIQEGKVSLIEEVLRTSDSVLSRILTGGIKNVVKGRMRMREAMEDIGQSEIKELEKNIRFIGTVVTISPLLGLLGTVTGMVKVFQAVSREKNPEIASLAMGIWEALITTVAGLAVAIIAFVAFRYLSEKINKLSRKLEEISLEFLNKIEDIHIKEKEIRKDEFSESIKER